MLTLLSFVLATLLPVTSVEIPEGIAAEFRHQAEVTRHTGLESFYCLIGRLEGTNAVVTGAVKPRQFAYTESRVRVFVTLRGPARKAEWRSVVNHDRCPPGTIMDIHTHPFGTLMPSDIDVRAWSTAPYSLHGIATALPDGSGRVIFAVWNREGTKTLDDVRSVP